MGYYRSLIRVSFPMTLSVAWPFGFGFFTLELGRLLRQNGKKDVFIGRWILFPPGPAIRPF